MTGIGFSVDAVLKTALDHHQAGRLPEAERLYRDVLAINPGHADALHFLGMIAHQVGRDDISAALIAKAIGVDRANPLYHRNLGVSLFRLGRYDEALAAYDSALALKRDYAEAHHNRADTLRQMGRLDEAIAAYTTAVDISPDHVFAHLNLGNVLKSVGRPQEAIAAYDRAIAVKPDYAEVHSNRGAILNDLGRREEAVAAYDQAIRFKPDYAEAHSNRGNALKDLGRLEEAIGAYDQALLFQPGHAGFLCNRGVALNELGRLEEAVATYDEAIRINSNHDVAHKNRGVALNELGRNAEAIAAHDEAIRIKPDDAEAHSNRLMALHYGKTAGAHAFLPYARQYGAQFDRPSPSRPFANAPDPERRLRVGYVSADFRRHAVGFLLAEVLASHAPSAVEVFCYSNNPRDDDLTARLRRSAHHWRKLVGLSDEKTADLVRNDRIDILVDLSGHTAGNRLPMFALRPAPVQATWLGYFGTTGLAAMDYVLADRFVVPAAEEGCFTERIYRLPNSYLCFSVPDVYVPAAEPSDLGSRPLTFGSFNNHSKTSPTTVHLWAQVLKSVPGSRLLLKTRALGDVAARRRLTENFAEHDIQPERLLLEGSVPRTQLLAAYRRLDVALDPTPYGGGVTTLEALWMGVPVVTLRGNTWVGRVSESILTTIGLPELVAGSEAEYVEIAARIATDAVRRTALSAELRGLAEASPLFQAGRFASDLEAAYRNMWREWCGRNERP